MPLNEGVRRFVDRRDGHLARHAGEPFEEVVKRLAARKVVEQDLHGDPGATKNGGAGYHFRVHTHDGTGRGGGHVHMVTGRKADFQSGG